MELCPPLKVVQLTVVLAPVVVVVVHGVAVFGGDVVVMVMVMEAPVLVMVGIMGA